MFFGKPGGCSTDISKRLMVTSAAEILLREL
jgi:hypothetical protein